MPSPIYWLCALFLLSQCAYGSDVLLTSDPKVIQTILTQKMQMECKLNDSIHSDLQFVTSLLVSRNGKSLATITPFSPVQAYMDLDKLNVSGQVTTQNGAQGYLKLEWTYPDQGQSGNYTCDVNGVNSVGHPVIYTTSVYISSREPSLSDITLHVRDQEIQINKQIVENFDLKMANQKYVADISALQSNMKAQQDGLSSLKTHNILMNNKLDEVLTVLDETRHIENGTLSFGKSNSADWTDVGSYMERNLSCSFAIPYGKTPVVHFTPVHVDSYNSNANFMYSVKYWLDLMDVNGTDFTLRMRAEGASTSYLYFNQFDVDWISLGKPDQ